MRIGIDARFFGPQETGIGRYVERLISHLGDIDQQHTYVVFLRRQAFDSWRPPNHRWEKRLADYRWYTFAEQLFMPGVFRASKCDIIHIPHFNVPLFIRQRYVVTVHDLILSRFPTPRASTLTPLIYRIKHLAYTWAIRHAVMGARAIITVSEHAKKDIQTIFHLPDDRVSVTYESVDPLPPPVSWETLAAKGIHQPFLLHVGNSYPHKNLERLLQAVRLAHQRGEQFQLVMVGKRDYFSTRLEKEYADVPDVRWFGFASDEELSGLYAHARGYIFPSLSEGFGLPGLEAMAAGTPLYAARASCLPEVFGSAAHFFDPLDVSNIAASIQTALHDTLERQRLIDAGRVQVAKYSWERMARQTLAIYQNVYAGNPHQPSRSTNQRS